MGRDGFWKMEFKRDWHFLGEFKMRRKEVGYFGHFQRRFTQNLTKNDYDRRKKPNCKELLNLKSQL